MKTVSYIVDLAIFFALYFVFDTSWLVAFLVSSFIGGLIRAAFTNPSQRQER